MNYKYGKIVKDDLVEIYTPFQVQEDLLTEDLFQLQHFDGELVLDVGWYKREKVNCFCIYIIKSQDWEKPIYKKDIFNTSLLEKEFYFALEEFNNIIENYF